MLNGLCFVDITSSYLLLTVLWRSVISKPTPPNFIKFSGLVHICRWVWSIRLFHDRSRDVAIVTVETECWRESATIGIPHVHSVCWHSTTDGKIATWLRALTPPMIPIRLIKNVVNFGSVTLEFCRHVCAGRAIRWALPRISSFFSSERRTPADL